MFETLWYIGYALLLILLGNGLVYILSRIQMKGWLAELNKHLDNKIINFLKKEQNGEEEEK